MVSEGEFPLPDPEFLKDISENKLLAWLAYSKNSIRPELYIKYLPDGLDFVSGPQAVNCFDFAQGRRGVAYLDTKNLVRAERKPGNMVVYYLEQRPVHAGILIEDGQRVMSQWGVGGAVMKHKLMQIPPNYGRNKNYWKPK